MSIESHDMGNITNTGDARADKEEKSVTRKQYDGIQQQRKSDFKLHVHKVSIFALYCVAVFYTCSSITWLVHLILPKSVHFMPEENFATLQSLLFGTIVGGLASQFARRVLD